MKIALVAPTTIPSRRANTIQVMKMAKALMVNGHAVHLTSPGEPPQPRQGDAPESSNTNTWPDLKHHYGLTIEFPITWLSTHPSLRGYDYALRAVRFARRLRANILYTRHPQTAALSSLLGQPTVFEIHDLPQGAGKFLLQAYLAGQGARHLVTITHALTHDINTRYRIHNIVTLPDGVDLSRYQNLPGAIDARVLIKNLYQLPITHTAFTIGYTGHFYPGRGIELILSLADCLPNFQFLLVGGNPSDVERLRAKMFHDQASRTNCHFIGFVPNADLPLYQAACDVLLMPYQTQVAASSGGNIAPYLSPMKLFEYLATGRVLLSSNLPVFREILNLDNAVLLPPDDIEKWADALLDLSQNPEKRATYGANARLHAEKYTWETRAAKILDGLEL